MTFREYGSYLSASRALESGEVDAFIADGSILSGFSDEGRVLLPDQLSVQEYGVGRSNLMTEYDQMYLAKLRNTVYYLGVAFYYYTVQGPDGAAGDGRAQPR